MKKKMIGMVISFTMMATGAWAGLPGVPDGTFTDIGAGLVWLLDATCYGKQNWQTAMSSVASLKSGSCGLNDGSKAGQWRLPTKIELTRRRLNMDAFLNVQAGGYWSSTDAGHKYTYYDMDMGSAIWFYSQTNEKRYFMAVRAVQ